MADLMEVPQVQGEEGKSMWFWSLVRFVLVAAFGWILRGWFEFDSKKEWIGQAKTTIKNGWSSESRSKSGWAGTPQEEPFWRRPWAETHRKVRDTI